MLRVIDIAKKVIVGFKVSTLDKPSVTIWEPFHSIFAPKRYLWGIGDGK